MTLTLSSLGFDSSATTETEDRLGGGDNTLDTNAYKATIKCMFLGQSKGGAMNVTIQYIVAGKEHSETIYISNKKGETFYSDKTSGEKRMLPGFNMVNAILMLATGEPLDDKQSMKELTIKLYDYDKGAEVNTAVQTFRNAADKEVILGIQRVLENKNVLQGGAYVPTAQIRRKNEIAVVANTAKFTFNETQSADVEEPVFLGKWVEKNQGNDYDKTVKVAGSPQGAAAGTGTPTPDAFGGAAAAGTSKLPGL